MENVERIIGLLEEAIDIARVVSNENRDFDQIQFTDDFVFTIEQLEDPDRDSLMSIKDMIMGTRMSLERFVSDTKEINSSGGRESNLVNQLNETSMLSEIEEIIEIVREAEGLAE